MTDKQINALETAAKAATPGPWVVDRLCGISVFHETDGISLLIASCYEGQQSTNAAYIAAANPATILELVQELRQARAERDFILEQVDDMFDADDLLQAAKETTSCQK